MKVIARTLLTLATGAAGVMATPALAGPGVHLVTSIETLSRTPNGVRYAVTVRPAGGPAHAATLVLSTRRPAAWTAAPTCLSSADRTALACDLGDLRESEQRRLLLVADPGDGPAQVPVIAQARAANAPSVTSSLGVNHPVALRLPGESPPVASPEPSGEPSPSASPEVVESPSAVPGESGLVSPPPAAVLPQRPPPVTRPRAPRAHLAPSHAPAGVRRPPVVPHAPVIPHAVIPHAPVIPPMPVPPVEVPASPPPLMGGPPIVPSTPSPALPQLAPHSPSGSGISELDTLSPTGAMQAGRTSWATLIAIAVTAEAGLLWLIAGLTVWRRKRTPNGGRRLRAGVRVIP